MRHRICTSFDRPDSSLLERAAKTHVGVSGVHAGPRQVMHAGIKPLLSTWRICGPAFTVRPEYTEDLLTGEVAGKYAQSGDVIVVDAGGRIDVACWGMGMSMSAARAGCAGVVLDGACMNSALLTRERVQLPIFARALVASARGAEKAGSINVPVICGGVIVHPGDIILGDSDGVVVLPAALAEAIVKRSEGYAAQASQDNAADVAYYERRRSEEKMRALPDIDWS